MYDFGRLFIVCTIMLTCILMDLPELCASVQVIPGKVALLSHFLVIVVILFRLGWLYFDHLFTKNWSYFGRLFSNIWSYFCAEQLTICNQSKGKLVTS